MLIGRSAEVIGSTVEVGTSDITLGQQAGHYLGKVGGKTVFAFVNILNTGGVSKPRNSERKWFH